MHRPKLNRAHSPRLEAAHPGHIWAYDFVEDTLADGRTFKVVTVIDEFTREGLGLDVASTTLAERVISVLAPLFGQYGAPIYLRSDNGAEFVAQSVQLWLFDQGYKRFISSQASGGRMARRSDLTELCAVNA